MSTVIDVTVSAIHCMADPDPAVVTDVDTLLKFVLDGASLDEGYKFCPTNAIEVRDPQGQFIGSWTVEDGKVALVDLKTLTGLFHYDVRAKDKDGQTVLLSDLAGTLSGEVVFDPMIKNDA